MSLRAADSLSNGFENPLESHLHSADGFFREHTTLPASEVYCFSGRHRQVVDQGGANWLALHTIYRVRQYQAAVRNVTHAGIG